MKTVWDIKYKNKTSKKARSSEEFNDFLAEYLPPWTTKTK